jgi:hypothetical protein
VRDREKASGVDHRDLACYASRLTPHVRDHLAHAAQEIEKLYGQLPSAASFESQQREHWEEGREDYIESIRSVLGHLASALTAVGCTDEQLALGESGEDPEPAPLPDEPDEPETDEQLDAPDSDPEKTIGIPFSGVKALAVADLKKRSR